MYAFNFKICKVMIQKCIYNQITGFFFYQKTRNNDASRLVYNLTHDMHVDNKYSITSYTGEGPS